MDQDKISKFIKDIRKNNNLTQREFASKYGITYQAVSKWENARGIPDISILRQICKDYNISLDEILEGEYSKKKKRKKIILIITIICLILIIILFINNKNKESFEFKTLTSNCNNFTISGNISYNTQKSAIYITNIKYCGTEDNTEYDEIECVLYEESNNKKIEISSYSYKSEEKITLDNFLQDVTFIVDNYDKVCNNYSSDTLNLIINAKIDNKIVKYEVPLSINNSCN